MNPFTKKIDNAPTTAAAPAFQGYNPFAVVDETPDRLPLLEGGVRARAKVLAYRITPRTPTSGTYVYVDLELLEVFAGMEQPGDQVTHRLGGFESSGAGAVARSLNELNFAIMPELKNKEGVSRSSLPGQMADSEEVKGREIFISTTEYVTKFIDPKTNKPRIIIKGEYKAAK